MRLTSIGLAILLVSVFVAAAIAQTSSAILAEGTVVSSTATSLTLRSDTGEERTFTIDSATQLPGMLTPGSRMRVEYRNEGGILRAAMVTAVEPTSGSGTEETPSTTASGDYLPGTASPGPLLLLLGLLAFAGAAVVRLASRRP